MSDEFKLFLRRRQHDGEKAWSDGSSERGIVLGFEEEFGLRYQWY